jgi:hypothetical protein
MNKERVILSVYNSTYISKGVKSVTPLIRGGFHTKDRMDTAI